MSVFVRVSFFAVAIIITVVIVIIERAESSLRLVFTRS